MEGNQKKGHAKGGSKIHRVSDVSKKSRVNDPARETKKPHITLQKRFKLVDKCCNLECFRNVDASSQQYLFDEFWKQGKSKQIQDLNLASCLKNVLAKRQKEKVTAARRVNQWKYHVRLGSVDVRVCSVFLIGLYQLTKKRIRIIQQKILRGETSFHEKRGRHRNRPNKTPLYILPFIKQHLSLISLDEMLYMPTRGHKILRIDFKKLFDEFRLYYENTNQTSVPITCRMYKTMYRSIYPNQYPACSSVEVEVVQMEGECSQGYQTLVGGQPQSNETEVDPLAPFFLNGLPDVDEIRNPGPPLSPDDVLESVEIHSITIPSVPATKPAPVPDTFEDIPASAPPALPQSHQDSNTPSTKAFTAVDKCCVQKCYEKFDVSSQRYLHDEFWKQGQSKQLQDLFLASCLKKVDVMRPLVDLIKPQRQNWNYFVCLGSNNIRVCLSFFTNLYGISLKRVRIIQSRILRGDTSFKEQRGRGSTLQKARIPPKVIPLMKKHLFLLPHYKTNGRIYFKNPDVDLKKLFNAFRQYYQEQTATALEITFDQYSKLFRINSDFNFATNYTNECSVCACFDTVASPTQTQSNAKLAHEEICKTFVELKQNLIQQAKAGDILLIEFDYIPYICVPRLNVTEELYKSLPFVYGFNVHNHSDDSSYMYLFPESKSVRDVDPVISFIFATIQPILESKRSYQKVVLLCNNCQGQSKNISLVRFCSWMSVIHNIPFRQVFPIPGHSTTICSQNFDLFWAKNKMRKRLLSVKPILVDMVTARPNPSPFIVSYNWPIIERWGEALNILFSSQLKHANGQKFNLINYEQLEHVNGCVYANTTFLSNTWMEFTHLIKNIDIRKVLLQPTVPPGIHSSKRQNVFSLFHLLTSDEIIKFQESFAI